jgi:pyruvate/2-oxoglutarate dehydrogenase complex dihydrolipoamide dehydrogenase (E3) component
MSRLYGYVVIGGGSAGLLAAPLAAKLGIRVALIERDRPGGDCLYTGCVPSKTLLRVARAAHEQRQAKRLGLTASAPAVDMARVSAHVQQVIERVGQHDSPESLRATGIDLILGAARFVDRHTVQAGGQLVRGRKFLICTGSRPAAPAIPGLADIPTLTYEDLFSLRTLPQRLLVLGGGPVGVEMGQAFERLGSRVTLLQSGPRLLPQADPAASEILADVLRTEGIDVRLGTVVGRVARRGDEIVLTIAGGGEVVGDQLLVATGRAPVLDGLSLERAGIAHTSRGIQVDGSLRTSQPHIYACGDVLGGEQFTHLAAIQAYHATRNALLPGKMRSQLATVPWTIFSDPEVARAGLTEAEARARYGREVHAYTLPLSRVDRAQTDEDLHGMVKLVFRSNGRLLGAHIVAARAGEMIQEAIAVIERGGTLAQLAGTVHVYPTYAVGLQQAASYALEQQYLRGWRGRLIRLGVRALSRLV